MQLFPYLNLGGQLDSIPTFHERLRVSILPEQQLSFCTGMNFTYLLLKRIQNQMTQLPSVLHNMGIQCIW